MSDALELLRRIATLYFGIGLMFAVVADVLDGQHNTIRSRIRSTVFFFTIWPVFLILVARGAGDDL